MNDPEHPCGAPDFFMSVGSGDFCCGQYGAGLGQYFASSGYPHLSNSTRFPARFLHTKKDPLR